MKKEFVAKEVIAKESVDSIKVVETTVYKKGAALLKLECNNCGGNLDIVDNTHAKCPHCGQNYTMDEAGNIRFDLTMDYGDRGEVYQSIKGLLKIITIFILAAVVVVGGILFFNIMARACV